MNVRRTETANTRFASNSPPRGGEQSARDGRARSRRFRSLLAAWSLFWITVAVVVLASFAQGASNPPYTAGAAQVTVNPCSGGSCVTFSLPNAYVNLTFANGFTANSQIQLPGYGKSLVIDSTNITLYKNPASWPGISLSVTTWNPSNTVLGTAILVAQVTAPATTKTLYLNLSGLTPNQFVFPLVNAAAQGGMVTDGSGSAQFSFWSWSTTTQTIEIDVGQVQGGPGLIRVMPRFTYSRFFDFFNASSDEYAQFHDLSASTSSSGNLTSLWKFGDGSSSTQSNPLHRYAFGLSATFNVTLLECAGTVCNVTSQSVSMVRWHTAVLAVGVLLIGVAGLVAIWRARRFL